MAILRTYNPETGKWEEVPVVAGKNGKSAYEYAKEGGFTGTEAEFSAQLGSTASVLGEAKQYTDDKVRDASNESAAAIGALQGAVNGKAAASDLASHVGNANNPHGVTAAQIGAEESGAAAAALEAAKQYTDDEIAELINGAPTTLDTLGEIATAMADNADVVTALHKAVGSKADAQTVASLQTAVAGKAEASAVVALETAVNGKAPAADLTAHTGNKNNPHGVTAEQAGALPTSGGTLTGAITLPNNTAIKSKDGSGTAQEVLRANGSNQIVLGAAGIWDLIVSYHGLVPATSAVDALDLGAGGRRWRNLFLSGSISDGTNSVKVSDIAKKNDIPTVPDKTENWTFTLEDGSTVTKAVYLK